MIKVNEQGNSLKLFSGSFADSMSEEVNCSFVVDFGIFMTIFFCFFFL